MLSSADASNLDKSIFFSFGEELNDREEESFLKSILEKKKVLLTCIIPSFKNAFYHSQNKLQFSCQVCFAICTCFQFKKG